MRQALDRGRDAEARQLADRLALAAPTSREAADLQIQSRLAGNDVSAALAAYDRFASATKAQDARLLAGIARVDLRHAADASAADPKLECDALERLARYGEPAARERLVELATESKYPGVQAVANAALARLGDSGAVARLTALAWEPNVRDKTLLVEGLAQLPGGAGLSELRALLQDPNPSTRVAAATALADRSDRDSIGAIRTLLNDELPEVRSYAAVALGRLGDPAADDLVARMRKSPVSDSRLDAVLADRAMPAADRRAAVAMLLDDADSQVRLRAAKALLAIDPGLATTVLAKLATDGAFLGRADAAALLESQPSVDVALLRRLLADPLSWVRLHAAGATLKAASGTK